MNRKLALKILVAVIAIVAVMALMHVAGTQLVPAIARLHAG